MFIQTDVDFNIGKMKHKHEDEIPSARKPCGYGWDLVSEFRVQSSE